MAAPTKKKKRSTLKRIRQNARQRKVNTLSRSAARTAVREARTAIATGAGNAGELLRSAASALDKAAKRGTVHRNSASRRKGRIAKAAAKAREPPGQMQRESRRRGRARLFALDGR
ncbi:MAG TPA: 30S ribosomal protein S20, partial [Candidatus Limnocylindrales bacterium]|nr:30S ribosomal protein S20 [Candidatus Limnocylindrales bacterium]